MNIDVLDSLIYNEPVGKIIEPYNVEDNVWFFGKTFGTQSRPDSILVARLIVDFKNAQNPNGTRTKKMARHESDSLKNAILSGQSIFAMIPDYSLGRQVTDTTMWFEEKSIPLKLYNELLKTPAGGIYIDHENIPFAFVVYQVLDRTVPIPKRQYALYAFDIKASDNTINHLRSVASQIAASSTSAEDLVVEANSKGVQVINGNAITSMVASIGTIQDCRVVVHWAFDKERKMDHVSEVYKLSDQMFIVASLKKITPKGTLKFEDVKEQITAELQNKKKIAAVEAMLKSDASSSSMANIATKYNTNLLDSAMFIFTGESYQNRGLDNMAIGKLFANPTIGENKVISGKNMIYVVSLYNVEEQPASMNFQVEKNMLRNILLGHSRNEMLILEGLKDKANIWDNRSRFYQ